MSSSHSRAGFELKTVPSAVHTPPIDAATLAPFDTHHAIASGFDGCRQRVRQIHSVVRNGFGLLNVHVARSLLRIDNLASLHRHP
jgi:hypothetical protein